MKKVIQHSPTGAYLLNTHSLHNYRRILSVLAPDLRKQLTAAIVTNHDSLRLHAATLLRAAKVTEGEPAPTGSVVGASEQPAPAFVKATANRNKKAPGTTKTKGKGRGNPSKVAPDNAAVSTSANHTTTVSTSNPGASSVLPVPAAYVPAASSNAAALPLPDSSIRNPGHVVSSVVPPQAYPITAYPAPAHYYSHSASSTPPALPANSVVSPPAHYYPIPPHPSAPSYYTPLHPYAPVSGQGYYWVGPTGSHQPVYAPTPGPPTALQPERNVNYSYHQWGNTQHS